mgnify:CR=1 FL=1
MTMLDKMGVNPEIQEQYAEQIAMEDISESNQECIELLKSNINIGEIL